MLTYTETSNSVAELIGHAIWATMHIDDLNQDEREQLARLATKLKELVIDHINS